MYRKYVVIIGLISLMAVCILCFFNVSENSHISSIVENNTDIISEETLDTYDKSFSNAVAFYYVSDLPITAFEDNSDTILINDGILKIKGIRTRNTKASTYLYFTVKGILEDVDISLNLYNEEKELIQTEHIIYECINSKYLYEVIFNFQADACYINVASATYTLCSSNYISYADLDNMHELGTTLKFLNNKIKVDTVSNNQIKLKGRLKSSETCYLFLHNRKKQITDVIKLEQGRLNTTINTTYGTKFYSVCLIK